MYTTAFTPFKFRKPRRVWFPKKSFHTFNRQGCIFHINSSSVLLNPEDMDAGEGIALVKPVDENEPVGVYFIDGVNPTKQEEAEAMFSYLYAVGKPRRGMWVLPAYCFPNCIDNSPENLQALREKGALIPNSVDKE